MNKLYIEVEIEVIEEWDINKVSSELLGTVVWVELEELMGFEGVCNRVAIKPF